MQKTLLCLLALAAPLAVNAQQVFVQPQTVSQPEVVEAHKNLAAPQQVYVVQQAPQQSQQQQQQVVPPQQVTVVEDTPLRESKADQLRRSRMEVETETEQRIVEKLESERMRAERARAEKISKALDGQQEEQKPVEPAPAPVVIQQAPMQAVQQSPVVVESAPVMYAPTPAPEKSEEPVGETKMYVTGMAGMPDYPSATNIRGNYNAGFGFGVIFPDRLILEGSFMLSNLDIEIVNPITGPSYYYPQFMEIDQTNYMAALKYQMFDGRIRPTVGGLVSYTQRTYKAKKNQYYGGYSYSQQAQEITSHAVDLGFSLGVDVELSKNLSVGLDMKYLGINVRNQVDGGYQTSMYSPEREDAVEGLDYMLMSFGGRLTF